jgi:hypothetical protein
MRSRITAFAAIEHVCARASGPMRPARVLGPVELRGE